MLIIASSLSLPPSMQTNLDSLFITLSIIESPSIALPQKLSPQTPRYTSSVPAQNPHSACLRKKDLKKKQKKMPVPTVYFVLVHEAMHSLWVIKDIISEWKFLFLGLSGAKLSVDYFYWLFCDKNNTKNCCCKISNIIKVCIQKLGQLKLR